jgi:hypothetical protein
MEAITSIALKQTIEADELQGIEQLYLSLQIRGKEGCHDDET